MQIENQLAKKMINVSLLSLQCALLTVHCLLTVYTAHCTVYTSQFWFFTLIGLFEFHCSLPIPQFIIYMHFVMILQKICKEQMKKRFAKVSLSIFLLLTFSRYCHCTKPLGVNQLQKPSCFKYQWFMLR